MAAAEAPTSAGQKRPANTAFPGLDAGQGDDPVMIGQGLLEAASRGNLDQLRALMAQGAEPSFQENEGGISPLMAAARRGHADVLRTLLEAGAPWNAVDRRGRSAGDHAMEAMSELEERLQRADGGGGEGAETEGSSAVAGERINEAFNILLNAGLQSELVLGAAERRMSSSEAGVRNAHYLQDRLEFGEGKILDADKAAVMMQWEHALMEAHAQAICQQGGDILNVGFGMGIIDSAIQSRSIRTHTIVEAHPDVLRRMEEGGWMGRETVRVVKGRWQDVLQQLGCYDGIFFDTYGEHYEDLREFHAHLQSLLKPDGVYSFFNGMCANSPFFHTLCCQLASLELAHLGLKTDFVSLPVAQCLNSDAWEGVKRRYWELDTYYLPVCYWAPTSMDAAE